MMSYALTNAEEFNDGHLLGQPLLTADEAAELLNVPRSTLYELVRSRGLPHVRIGERGLRFTKPGLAAWALENTYGTPRTVSLLGASDCTSSRSGRLSLLETERFGDSLGGVLAVDEREIAPRRRQISVAHPLHHLMGVGVADHSAAEGMAEVVEAEILCQSSFLSCGAVRGLQRLLDVG